MLAVTEKDALACFASSTAYPFDHVLWVNLIAFRQPLHRVDPADLHLATRSFCDQIGVFVFLHRAVCVEGPRTAAVVVTRRPIYFFRHTRRRS